MLPENRWKKLVAGIDRTLMFQYIIENVKAFSFMCVKKTNNKIGINR